ncbi:unnamed protein product [Nippostrongylus brasiliensis]|uniref:Seroin n=1 Tax=Nippostrongylus brasiliensis TaxID=27835 RepID=A0A0N4Y2Z3_NIPBR|nr:hypothetical protein Q1695_005331 [Nippostrongylus brasiliensis]VDL73721.1 unnamed protein product [Nippostrongylus brasiliensis]
MSTTTFTTVLAVVVVAFVAVFIDQVNCQPGIQNSNPFSFGGFNPFQGGVFSPDFGTNLANQIQQASQNAAKYGGISTVNGVTTATQNIGGTLYTAKLPAASSISVSTSNDYDQNGNKVQTVTVVVNGDTTLYKTVGGRTTVTDGNGKIRYDGGPFHIRNSSSYWKSYDSGSSSGSGSGPVPSNDDPRPAEVGSGYN